MLKNPELTIRYPHFAPFSDISAQHKISSHGWISGRSQIFKICITLASTYPNPMAPRKMKRFGLPQLKFCLSRNLVVLSSSES